MKKNMGSTDRILRFIVAAIAGILNFTGIVSGIIGIILLVLAIVFVITGFIGFCPLYKPLGINTYKKNK